MIEHFERTIQKFMADSKMFELDKYYRDCTQTNKPFIKARKNPGDGNYYVKLDLMTCDYRLTLEERNQVKRLFEKEFTLNKSNILPNISNNYSIDKELCWFDGIMPNRLSIFCEKLFDLIEQSKK